MTDQTWTWARLDEPTIALVEEAERAIGAGFVVVYAPGNPRRDVPASLPLAPAPLDERQLARLQQLETLVDGVAVAYRPLD